MTSGRPAKRRRVTFARASTTRSSRNCVTSPAKTGKKAQDQISNWRDTLDNATQDVRKELAKLAIRAQTSTEALDELRRRSRSAARHSS